MHSVMRPVATVGARDHANRFLSHLLCISRIVEASSPTTDYLALDLLSRLLVRLQNIFGSQTIVA